MRKHDEFLSTTDYTAQEYFERNGESQFPNAQAGIARTCLTYLSFDVYPCTDYDILLRDNPFLDYAARHWGDHARGQEEAVKFLALGFLQDSSKAAYAGDVLAAWWDRPANYSGMHLSSFFGLAKITDYQLKNGAIANSKSSKGKSPLSIAAENGHETVVELILAQDNVEINSRDEYSQTPLSWAAQNGHEAVVKMLLARDDIDAVSKDLYGETPLSWAAYNGHEAVVKLLLARDSVDVNSKDSRNRTPFSFAAERGHESVVKLLLTRDDVDINSKDSHNRTPLSWAAENGREAVVNLLLARDDVDVNSEDRYGRTPLSRAADRGHEVVVKLLLARDHRPLHPEA
jgi:ankyrin repeat protein